MYKIYSSFSISIVSPAPLGPLTTTLIPLLITRLQSFRIDGDSDAEGEGEGVTESNEAQPSPSILKDCNLVIRRGMRVVVRGPNGAGETTEIEKELYILYILMFLIISNFS